MANLSVIRMQDVADYYENNKVLYHLVSCLLLSLAPTFEKIFTKGIDFWEEVIYKKQTSER